MEDKNELRRRIDESGISITALAKKIGVSRGTLYKKVDGTSYFNSDEISGLIDALHLTGNDVTRIFFGIESDR